MGLFLSITSVIGKSAAEVSESLARYARSAHGDLQEAILNFHHQNCCVIKEENGNTSILNPYNFLDWELAAQTLSWDLNAVVFSFHIHNGDFWMYRLFVNSTAVDQFMPLPDYWVEEKMDENEVNKYKGNVEMVAKYAAVGMEEIANYLVRWDLGANPFKAYKEDEFANEEWQLLDFMRKLQLPRPINKHLIPDGQTYKFWTKDLLFA